MGNFSMMIGTICLTLLDVISLAMMLRVIMSFFTDEENMFNRILYAITEPLIAPVRKLLNKSSFLSGMPLDMSFMITYLLLIIVKGFLAIWF